MAKVRMIVIDSCGECPYCEVDDWQNRKGEMSFTFECSELGKPIYDMGTIKRDCPLGLKEDSDV